MTGALVSVIVPTYNRAQLLKPCLESLLAQTAQATEVLVVDDGSSDSTPSVVAGFGERVRYLRKPNGGKARAVNLALEQINGDWVWLFDDDDLALPQAIEQRLAALRMAPDSDWVFAPHVVGLDDGKGHIDQRRVQAVADPGRERLLLTLMTSCFFHLNSCLVRRSLYTQAGPFDPELKAGEDYDMQIRLAAASPRTTFCTEPVFVFRQHGGVRGEQEQRYAGSQREQVFMRYSRQLGQKLRKSLSLDAYLVPRRAPRDPADQRDALLGRAAVMGNLGCWAEMLDDLLESGQAGKPNTGWDTTSRQQLIRLFGNGWLLPASFAQWPEFVLRARDLARSPGGGTAVRALARGLAAVARGHAAPPAQRFLRLQRAGQLLALAGWR
jgi:hypothetical protein